MRQNLKILDCTLRDGGYYNNWNFSLELISEYIKAVNLSGVHCIEIGFRTLNKNISMGACAHTTDTFLNILEIPKNLKVAVMINASEFSNHLFFQQKKS